MASSTCPPGGEPSCRSLEPWPRAGGRRRAQARSGFAAIINPVGHPLIGDRRDLAQAARLALGHAGGMSPALSHGILSFAPDEGDGLPPWGGMPRTDVVACLVRDWARAMNGDRIPIVDDEKASGDTLRRLFAHEGRVVKVASCVTETPTKLEPPPLFHPLGHGLVQCQARRGQRRGELRRRRRELQQDLRHRGIDRRLGGPGQQVEESGSQPDPHPARHAGRADVMGGDEGLRSQAGNGNAWCQDKPSSWVDWTLAEANARFLQFVRRLIALRRRPSM
jgi:hypothetical protein